MPNAEVVHLDRHDRIADFAVILRRQLNVSSWGAHFVISMSLVLVQWSNATTILPSSKTGKRRGCSGGQANSFDERVYIPVSRRSYRLRANPRRALFDYFYITNYVGFRLRNVPCKESGAQSGLVCDSKGNGSSGFSGLLHIRV